MTASMIVFSGGRYIKLLSLANLFQVFVNVQEYILVHEKYVDGGVDMTSPARAMPQPPRSVPILHRF